MNVTLSQYRIWRNNTQERVSEILTCVPGLSFLTIAFHAWPVAGTSPALWDRGQGWQRQRRRSLQQHSVDHCKKETAEGIWALIFSAVEPPQQQSASWTCTLNSIMKNCLSWRKDSQGQRAVTWTRGRKNLAHPIFLYNWKTAFCHQRDLLKPLLFLLYFSDCSRIKARKGRLDNIYEDFHRHVLLGNLRLRITSSKRIGAIITSYRQMSVFSNSPYQYQFTLPVSIRVFSGRC